jgi:hypothetical protein
MSQYNNQGYLFPNHRKFGDAPDFTGKVTIGGIEYRLSAWKKAKGNDQMLSLSVQTQEQYEAGKPDRKKLPKEKDYEYREPEQLLEHQNGLGQDEIPF